MCVCGCVYVCVCVCVCVLFFVRIVSLHFGKQVFDMRFDSSQTHLLSESILQQISTK